MKNKTLSEKILWNDKILSILFGICVFIFFAFAYSFHLNYQEQFQLFLFTSEYFFQFINHPGGFSDFVGNFLTQFYFYSWFGAIIIALLLTLLQRVVWLTSLRMGAQIHWMPITFIPSLLYWSLLCDENYLLGGLIALLLNALVGYAYVRFRSISTKIFFTIISLPFLYWLTGGAFLIFLLIVLTREMILRELKPVQYAVFSFGILLLAVMLPFAAKWNVVQYPLMKFWFGVNYYRFPVNIPIIIGLIGISIFLIPFTLYWISNKIRKSLSQLLLLLQISILIIGGYLLIRSTADFSKEEVMEYDFNARMRRWDQIIKMADKKTPSSPLSVTCLNLALAKNDLLSNRMFHYYQNGVAGLLPDFTRDFTIPMIASEVYYHLGFVNTAQRFAFEAMEALPDYQKSARSVMRLAETNLINGNYEVAGKYFRILEKTFYYRNWAKKGLETMQDEKLINDHPEWGWLRKIRTQEDFLFSESEKEMMLGVLFRQNHENRMAAEYLLITCLLNKDLQHFLEYYPITKSLNYKVIPKSFQEALIYVWGLSNQDPTRNTPYPISNNIKQRVQAYGQIYTSQGNAESLLKDKFSDTYWFYLHYRN